MTGGRPGYTRVQHTAATKPRKPIVARRLFVVCVASGLVGAAAGALIAYLIYSGAHHPLRTGIAALLAFVALVAVLTLHPVRWARSQLPHRRKHP